MSVVKSEPDTTRKASRKSAKTQETVLSALLVRIFMKGDHSITSIEIG
ncbi:hypothetical protein AAAA53_23125 [Escherichia coli]